MNALQERIRDPEALKRAVEETLALPEFHRGPPEKSWIEERFNDFLRWLDDVIGIPGGAGQVLLYVLYTAAAILAIVLVVTLVRRYLGRGPREEAAVDPSALRARRVAELLERARAARSRGDLVDALRFHFWALVIGLSERGDLEYRDAWTNGELLRRGKPRTDARAILEPLVPRLDAQSFGHEPVVEADVERLAELCRAHLPREAA